VLVKKRRCTTLIVSVYVVAIMMNLRTSGRLLNLLLQRTGTFTELVSEPLVDVLDVLHPAGTGCLPPLCLHAPVIAPGACTGIATLAASQLLNVIRRATAPSAQRVGLVATLSER